MKEKVNKLVVEVDSLILYVISTWKNKKTGYIKSDINFRKL